jgi:N-glycosidase YbiA
MSDVVSFYRVSGDFGCFSNFAPYPVRMEGIIWPTSEHYFQAMKFEDDVYREKIRCAASPMIAAKMGRDRRMPIRKDWEAVKIGIMRNVVQAKFIQHPDIGRVLVSTGDAAIVEHTKNDSFWGDGGDGSGQNWLGRLLMDVRSELKKRVADGEAIF